MKKFRNQLHQIAKKTTVSSFARKSRIVEQRKHINILDLSETFYYSAQKVLTIVIFLESFLDGHMKVAI